MGSDVNDGIVSGLVGGIVFGIVGFHIVLNRKGIFFSR